jgi:hypothetical protein
VSVRVALNREHVYYDNLISTEVVHIPQEK